MFRVETYKNYFFPLSTVLYKIVKFWLLELLYGPSGLEVVCRHLKRLPILIFKALRFLLKLKIFLFMSSCF
jgi:hypothetical protein